MAVFNTQDGEMVTIWISTERSTSLYVRTEVHYYPEVFMRRIARSVQKHFGLSPSPLEAKSKTFYKIPMTGLSRKHHNEAIGIIADRLKLEADQVYEALKNPRSDD